MTNASGSWREEYDYQGVDTANFDCPDCGGTLHPARRGDDELPGRVHECEYCGQRVREVAE